MATIYSQSLNSITTSSKLLVRESTVATQPRSLERQKLAELTDTIWQHLTSVEQSLESPEDITETSYHPIPPKRSFNVLVRYQLQGRGKPLPYPLDLDDKQ